jgi:hypothetical protein
MSVVAHAVLAFAGIAKCRATWTGSIGTRSSCAGIWGRPFSSSSGSRVQPRLAGHGPTLFAGLSKLVDLKLVSRLEVVAMRHERGRQRPDRKEPFKPSAADIQRPLASWPSLPPESWIQGW